MNTEQIVQDEVENFVINSQWLLLDDPLRHAIRQAITREREACAKVCVDTYTGEESCGDWPTPEMCAAAIRARGNK